MCENCLLPHNGLKSCQDHIKLTLTKHLLLLFSLRSRTIELEKTKRGSPFLNFFLPLSECNLGNNDNVVGPSILTLLLSLDTVDKSDYGNGLDSLAKTHFICKNSVKISLI